MLVLVDKYVHMSAAGLTRSTLTRAGLAIVALAAVAAGLGLSPASESVDAAPRVPVYDTAWDMPFWASLGQVDQYFDHLQASGYTGVWLSVMNHTGGGLTGVSPTLGTTQATFNNNQFDLRTNYRDRFRQILDRAQARGLRVGVVPVWGHGYLHTNRNGACDGTNQGPLQANNSWEIGREIAQAFANHSAVQYWILGGDNFCSPAENGSIWANMAAGLEAGGANQPMTYHTAGWPGRHLLFADQPWVDFLSPQTAHCIPASEARRDLTNVVNATNKPVFAAEMRYEAIQPEWQCQTHGPGNPVRPADVRDDTQAALDAGVNAIVYGHNERWQWGKGVNGSQGGGWNSVRASFGAGGETAMLQLLGASSPPTTVPPTQPPGPSTRIEVIARGTTGSERIELRINESTVAGYNLTTGFQTFRFDASGQVGASQIKVAFVNDNGPRDVVVDAIVVAGQRFESEAANTRSLGSWDGSCDLGFKRTQALHCNGFFHYGQSGQPSTSTRVDVVARGATGTERLELRINDVAVRTFTVSTGFQSFGFTASGSVSPAQVKVALINDDGTNRDAIVDKVIIGGQTYESEAPSVRSTGTWSGSCAPGIKRSQVLHCNGFFHYGQA